MKKNSISLLLTIIGGTKLFSEGAGFHFGQALGYAMAAYYTQQVRKIRSIEIGSDITILIIAVIIMIVKKEHYGRTMGIAIFLCVIVDLIAQYAISQI